MNDLLLTKNYLKDPKDYWITCFDGQEGVKGDSFEKYRMTFTCRSCGSPVETDPVAVSGISLAMGNPDLKSIDPAEFSDRCKRLKEKERMGSPCFLTQPCAKCEACYLLLFGATEWQPTRYIIVLGGIYEYEK